MPQLVRSTKFACNVCDEVWDTRFAAMSCEKFHQQKAAAEAAQKEVDALWLKLQEACPHKNVEVREGTHRHVIDMADTMGYEDHYHCRDCRKKWTQTRR